MHPSTGVTGMSHCTSPGTLDLPETDWAVGRRREEHSGKTDLTHEKVWRTLLPYNTTRKYEQKDTQEAKGDKRGVEKVTLDLGSRVRTGGLENIEQLCRKLRKVGFLAGYAE